MPIIDKAREILRAVNTARSVENSITGAELSGTGLQSAWRRMADALGNADHFAEMFVAACKESRTGKEADAQTEKNSRTWNRDLQAANGMIGDAYRSGNMKSAKDYFAHLKTLRAQLANEISELKMNLDMADKMIAERDRMLFEGSPGEHKEVASEKAAIADVEASDARIKSLAPALVAAIDKGIRTIEGVRNMVDRDHPSTDYYGSSIGDALRGAMGRAPGIADDLTAEIKRNRAMNAEASSEWPRKKEASGGRPTLPSGRYADVDPGRLLGED